MFSRYDAGGWEGTVPSMCFELGKYLLGGFNRIADIMTVNKTYSNLPVHDKVRVRLFAYEIDVWGPDSTFSILVDGAVVATYNNTYNADTVPADSTNVAIPSACNSTWCPLGCGYDTVDYNRTVDLTVPHTGSTMLLTIATNLTREPGADPASYPDAVYPSLAIDFPQVEFLTCPTPTATASESASITVSSSATASVSSTTTPSASRTAARTPSPTSSAMPTKSLSASSTLTSSASATGSSSTSPSPSPSPSSYPWTTTLLYSANFSRFRDTEGWLGANTSVCWNLEDNGVPASVLGGFGRLQDGTVSLALTDIPARHEYIQVAFDFYAIDLWNDTSNFNVSVDGVVQLGGSKVSGLYFVGTLDDGCGQLLNPSGRDPGLGMDGFHQVFMEFPHTGDSTTITVSVFIGNIEGWAAIDNVRVWSKSRLFPSETTSATISASDTPSVSASPSVTPVASPCPLAAPVPAFTSTFSNLGDPAGWSVLASACTVNSVTNGVLGGYGLFGGNMTAWRVIVGLPAHDVLSLALDLIAIDSWSPSSTVTVAVDGRVVDVLSTATLGVGTTNLCGLSQVPDVARALSWETAHRGPTANVSITLALGLGVSFAALDNIVVTSGLRVCPSPSPSTSFTSSRSLTPSVTPSVSPSTTVSPSGSTSASASPSVSVTATLSPSASVSVTPSSSTTMSRSVGSSLSSTPSSSLTPSVTSSGSLTPSRSPSVTTSSSSTASLSTSGTTSATASVSPSVTVTTSPAQATKSAGGTTPSAVDVTATTQQQWSLVGATPITLTSDLQGVLTSTQGVVEGTELVGVLAAVVPATTLCTSLNGTAVGTPLLQATSAGVVQTPLGAAASISTTSLPVSAGPTFRDSVSVTLTSSLCSLVAVGPPVSDSTLCLWLAVNVSYVDPGTGARLLRGTGAGTEDRRLGASSPTVVTVAVSAGVPVVVDLSGVAPAVDEFVVTLGLTGVRQDLPVSTKGVVGDEARAVVALAVLNWLGLPAGAVNASVLQVAQASNHSITVRVVPTSNATVATVRQALLAGTPEALLASLVSLSVVTSAPGSGATAALETQPAGTSVRVPLAAPSPTGSPTPMPSPSSSPSLTPSRTPSGTPVSGTGGQGVTEKGGSNLPSPTSWPILFYVLAALIILAVVFVVVRRRHRRRHSSSPSQVSPQGAAAGARGGAAPPTVANWVVPDEGGSGADADAGAGATGTAAASGASAAPGVDAGMPVGVEGASPSAPPLGGSGGGGRKEGEAECEARPAAAVAPGPTVDIPSSGAGAGWTSTGRRSAGSVEPMPQDSVAANAGAQGTPGGSLVSPPRLPPISRPEGEAELLPALRQ